MVDTVSRRGEELEDLENQVNNLSRFFLVTLRWNDSTFKKRWNNSTFKKRSFKSNLGSTCMIYNTFHDANNKNKNNHLEFLAKKQLEFLYQNHP